MLDELRIQCPSCGIILDVRNSKHEAVKRITCPHCQKSLAVDFQEEDKPTASPKPADALYYIEMRIELQEGVNQIELPGCEHLEIKVVRLKDGNSKCLIRALQENHVSLNGASLEKDDQVALTEGDTIQTDETVLVYNKPGKASVKVEPVKKTEQPAPSSPVHVPQWIFALAAAAVALILVWCLWPSKTNSPSSPIAKTVVPSKAVSTKDSARKKQDSIKLKTKSLKEDQQAVTERQDRFIKSHHAMTDYELEQLVNEGDVNAQYELGNRLVHRSGRNNVIRGIKYLRLAANRGSSKASSVLNKAVNALQQRAEAGDTVAYSILMSIQ